MKQNLIVTTMIIANITLLYFAKEISYLAISSMTLILSFMFGTICGFKITKRINHETIN